MRLLYTFGIHLYSLGITLAALFSEKAKLLRKGRKETWEHLRQWGAKKQKTIWFHCASLGEYEQGKPLIQKMRALYPDRKFLVSFFSPSGYEIKKNDAEIDCAVYLPSDSKRHARRFIEMVKPESAFFVKYEYWFNFMDELYRQKIPFYYLSAIFRPSQYFFKPYGQWFAKQLQKCNHFFVQNTVSKDLLQSIGIKNVTITGDTRFDRVYTIAQQKAALSFVEQFKDNSKLIVAGSTWPPDEQVLQSVFSQIKGAYKLVIAPHVIDKEHIQSIQNLFKDENVICYSAIEGKELSQYNVLIIDAIGFLSKIYRYGEMAYIGGAFATGLHNTLEAAVFGIPLFFGPHYDHFNEAVELVNRGCAFSIHNADEMMHEIQLFSADEKKYQAICNTCRAFVVQNLGACERILEVIQ